MKLLAATVLLGLASVSAAQNDFSAEEVPAPAAEAAISSIHIVSSAEVSLSFLSKPTKDGQWARYDIEAGKDLYISCEDCFTDVFYFYLNTESRFVSYKLDAGHKYLIRWNKKEKLWDIFRVKS